MVEGRERREPSVKKRSVVKKIGSKKSTSKVTVSAHSASATPTPAAATTPAAAAVVPTTQHIVTTMSDAAVQECSALLTQVLGMIGEQAPLSTDEIRRSTKMRKGGAEVIPKILALCKQHGVTKIGSLTVEEMSDELKRGDALAQVGVSSSLVQKKVRESAMSAHGRSWQIGTTMYKTLKRMANDDPELALGLKSVEAFFKAPPKSSGKAKAKTTADAKATVPATAAAAEAPAVAAAPEATTPAPSIVITAAPTAAPVNGAGH
jgi:hypothetical protein